MKADNNQRLGPHWKVKWHAGQVRRSKVAYVKAKIITKEEQSAKWTAKEEENGKKFDDKLFGRSNILAGGEWRGNK